MPSLTMKNVSPRQLKEWKNNFFIYHKSFSISEKLIDETFVYLGRAYTVLGLDPNNHKKRIITVETAPKKRIFKFSSDQIPPMYLDNNPIAHVIVKNRKEIERELKRLFNSIWLNKDYFNIATPDGKLIARYDKLSNIVRIHTENVQPIKKSR